MEFPLVLSSFYCLLFVWHLRYKLIECSSKYSQPYRRHISQSEFNVVKNLNTAFFFILCLENYFSHNNMYKTRINITLRIAIDCNVMFYTHHNSSTTTEGKCTEDEICNCYGFFSFALSWIDAYTCCYWLCYGFVTCLLFQKKKTFVSLVFG